MVDIIVANWNTKDYTRRCVNSIQKNTKTAYHLILIDNGSTDGSVEWINTLHFEKILNKCNLGFAKAINQGIRVGKSELICCLNSDTIVTNNWLFKMIEGMNIKKCDAVGPLLITVKDDHFTQLRIKTRYALLRFLMENHGWPQDIYINNLTGRKRNISFACILFKRDIIRKIGYLDESFGIGSCEDMDFCRRAMDAGFQFYYYKKSVVYHIGSHRTFEKNVDKLGDYRKTIFEESEKKYLEKWGSW